MVKELKIVNWSRTFDQVLTKFLDSQKNVETR